MGTETEIIKTPIKGLKIKLNKVVQDKRGFLAELLPQGTQNEFIKEGQIGNFYMSVGGKKGLPRGGHYHNELVENFYTISGRALWYFEDMREGSGTEGENYAVILGEKEKGESEDDVDSYLLPEKMAQVLVPTGVYHVFYPVSKKKVKVLACGSHPYDPDDYVDIDPEELAGAKNIFEKVR